MNNFIPTVPQFKSGLGSHSKGTLMQEAGSQQPTESSPTPTGNQLGLELPLELNSPKNGAIRTSKFGKAPDFSNVFSEGFVSKAGGHVPEPPVLSATKDHGMLADQLLDTSDSSIQEQTQLLPNATFAQPIFFSHPPTAQVVSGEYNAHPIGDAVGNPDEPADTLLAVADSPNLVSDVKIPPAQTPSLDTSKTEAIYMAEFLANGGESDGIPAQQPLPPNFTNPSGLNSNLAPQSGVKERPTIESSPAQGRISNEQGFLLPSEKLIPSDPNLEAPQDYVENVAPQAVTRNGQAQVSNVESTIRDINPLPMSKGSVDGVDLPRQSAPSPERTAVFTPPIQVAQNPKSNPNNLEELSPQKGGFNPPNVPLPSAAFQYKVATEPTESAQQQSTLPLNQPIDPRTRGEAKHPVPAQNANTVEKGFLGPLQARTSDPTDASTFATPAKAAKATPTSSQLAQQNQSVTIDATQGVATPTLEPLTSEQSFTPDSITIETSRVALSQPQHQAPLTAPQLNPELARSVAQQLSSAAMGEPNRPMELALSPEELGRVKLTFSPSENGMIVSVIAERPETLELMRRNINSLAQEFLGMGYEQISFNFNQSNSEQQQNGQYPSDSPKQLTSENPSNGFHESSPITIDLMPSDRVDIRI